MFCSAALGVMLPLSTDGRTLLPVVTTSGCTRLSSIGYTVRWSWLTKLSICWLTGLLVEVPLIANPVNQQMLNFVSQDHLTKLSICWLTGLLVEVPLISNPVNQQ